MSYNKKRIAIVFSPRQRTPYLENISAGEIAQIEKIIRGNGWKPYSIVFRPDTIESRIRHARPDIIVNLCYGWVSPDGTTRISQPETTALLETFGIALTGNTAKSQQILQDKLYTGRFLQRLGFETPREIHAGDNRLSRVLVKPRFGACHRGVRIVQKSAQLNFDDTNEVIQEYIEGPELTIGVVETQTEAIVLSPVEIVSDKELGLLSWKQYYAGRRIYEEKDLGLRCIAQRLFLALGLRDCARFDLRLRGNTPVFFDINPLPNLNPKLSLLPFAARSSGMSYGNLITTLIENALARSLHADITSKSGPGSFSHPLQDSVLQVA